MIGVLCLVSVLQSPGTLVALPFARGSKIFTTRELGKGKVAFCVQDGVNGAPKVLLDSTQDPTMVRYPLDGFCVSDDARYLTYFLPAVAHRFEEIRVLDIAKGKMCDDVIPWTFLSDLAWNGHGFYYGRYPAPPDASAPTATRLPTDYDNEKIYFHVVGTPLKADRLVFEDPRHPKQKYLYLEGFDHRWFHLHMLPDLQHRGVSSEWFFREGTPEPKITAIQPSLVPARFLSCDDVRDKFVMFTNYKSPKGRVIVIDPKHPLEADWKTIVPETEEEMTGADAAAGKLICEYAPNGGGSRVEIRNMNGKLESVLPISNGSDADVQWCGPSAKEFFLSVSKDKGAKAYYRYVVASKELIPFE
jgi:prolyl oligopeptidase